jgi:hypothetical protein
MLKFIGLLLVCLSLLCGAFARPVPSNAGPEKLIWTGESGGFVIRWTTENLSAKRYGSAEGSVFNVRPIIESEWKEIERDRSKRIREGESLVDFQYDRSIEVLSIVGPLVSISDNEGCDCGGAHPSAVSLYKALDLSRPGAVDLSYDGFKKRGKMVQLTDYFAEADILKALLADTIIQKALKSSGKPRPQTLAALMKAVYLQSVPVGECDYELSDDLLTRFAFHHLENDRVAVRLGLSHAVETCRGSLIELGILLPIPAALKQPLMRAQSGTAGFLMKDQKKIAREQMTSIAFTTEKSGQP